jgi:hypothetical protein
MSEANALGVCTSSAIAPCIASLHSCTSVDREAGRTSVRSKGERRQQRINPCRHHERALQVIIIKVIITVDVLNMYKSEASLLHTIYIYVATNTLLHNIPGFPAELVVSVILSTYKNHGSHNLYFY